jgi:hypothetical protein
LGKVVVETIHELRGEELRGLPHAVNAVPHHLDAVIEAGAIIRIDQELVRQGHALDVDFQVC